MQSLTTFSVHMLVLALALIQTRASIFDTPQYWSFAVRDSEYTTVIFPQSWPSLPSIAGLRFEVAKSKDASFSFSENVPFDSQSSVNGLYFAIDPWNGTLMHYRVAVYSPNEELVDASIPLQAIDQKTAVFVSPQGFDYSGCGNLRSGPCKSIQAALTSAEASGLKVYTTPGEYSGEGNYDINTAGRSIEVKSTNGPQYSVINCTDPLNSRRGFSFTSGESEDTLIEGFTIIGGEESDGGCILIRDSSPRLNQLVLVNCRALSGSARGGGIFIEGPNSKPMIENSLFYYNQANEGGAIHVTNGAALRFSNSVIDLGICPSGTGLGGGIFGQNADVRIDDSIIRNCISAFGGGGMLFQDSVVTMNNVEVSRNAVTNTGAGINLFGSTTTITNSRISENNSTVFGGGLLCTSSNLTVIETEFLNNYAGIGGAAIKLLGGFLNITASKISENVAGEYGAAFDVTTQGPLSSEKTLLYVSQCDISSNTADRGAALYLYDLDDLKIAQSIFRNNSASRGGAVWCRSNAPASFEDVSFMENLAREGGAIYVGEPCQIDIERGDFTRNGATDAGGAILATEGTQVHIASSNFFENGVSSCDNRQTPATGGAINFGVKDFDALDDVCSSMSVAKTTVLEVEETRFAANVARMAGGAIFAESGEFSFSKTVFEANRAGTLDNRDGYGGALALRERCIESECSVILASFTDTEMERNIAQLAGGGMYISGLNDESLSKLTNSKFVANRVGDAFSKGIGGGLYVEAPQINLTYVQFSNNSAPLGGGIYINSNFSDANSMIMDNVFMSENEAITGFDLFWEKLRSRVVLNTSALVSSNFTPASIATEALQVVFTSEKPQIIRSGNVADPFSISIIDYYGEVSIAENGDCQLVPIAGESDYLPSVRPLGSKLPVDAGNVHFTQVQITGRIGERYGMQILCTRKIEDLSGLVTSLELPPLDFEIEMADCPKGYTPAKSGEGDICIVCQYGSYNFDGRTCESCPKGATCPGGFTVQSKSNWWRSSVESFQFYPCKYPDVCKEGPAAGDLACANGHKGPLCGVCKSGWFQFGGKCRECNSNPTSKIFITISAIILVVIIVLLFAKSWEFGDPASPGLLSKVKILLMHFQIISLLKQYDILWPPQTSEGFSWLSVIDFGPSMMAPECIFGENYNYWMNWIIQTSLPILVLILCFGLYRIATVALDARNRSHPDGSKLTNWLEGLKLRCYKNAYWIITLLYPGACFVALQMFARKKLDIGTFLSADLSIKVADINGGFTSTYIGYMVPGAILLALLSLGVPLFCFATIWKHRFSLDEPEVAKKFGFLYGTYDRRTPYWETVQMLRRFVFALIPVFVGANASGSLQGTIAQVVALFLLVSTVWFMPFATKSDNYIEITSQIVINLLLISGCASTWASLSTGGLKALAAVQLFFSSVVCFIVFVSLALGIRKFLIRRRERKTAEKSESNHQINSAKGGNEVHVHVQTTQESGEHS